ncbi:aldose 1-epimerase [Coccidioides immitis H538.4]|uniref:Aldose 1-epimerase n=1 Tax=Coccidioides immitis H538.4 TaxID=396776 RepID=A0A0J8RFN4_COCIT|nr:aldose 1-epimerase [Coccidioides immitis H538.4]
MHYSRFVGAFLLACVGVAGTPQGMNVTVPAPQPAPAPTDFPSNASTALQVYTISANNITASFIPYGARLVSLLVPDRSGQQQDVVVGFDNPEQYVENVASNNAYLGPIVGRYANRIKNSTFILDGVEYKVPSNEFNDTQTLHGGPVGYDQRNWTVTNHTEDSITFALFDPGFENFPGKVVNLAAYTVSSSWSPDNASFETKLTTRTDK